ncbi:unnamed protein product [Phyllotreta striolata]|uniref:Uncharacterized protein n=1 Tax=Phyllotreta striolata TaxID=444603 RepID=A0A9N9XPL5_PHYSR|nr:unnamed protein product [Phyllotreta striolata]
MCRRGGWLMGTRRQKQIYKEIVVENLKRPGNKKIGVVEFLGFAGEERKIIKRMVVGWRLSGPEEKREVAGWQKELNYGEDQILGTVN